jgi:hypothetical protein
MCATCLSRQILFHLLSVVVTVHNVFEAISREVHLVYKRRIEFAQNN